MLSDIERDHLEEYWGLSRRFYEEGDHARAAFFAITLIEEIGKAVMLAKEKLQEPVVKGAFFNHEEKYAYAVAYNLMNNSRVGRVYKKQEAQFAKWFRDGELFKIRNSALYLEKTPSGTIAPKQAVKREDACLIVCFAGEIYGEIQGGLVGTGSDEWQRIIAEVDAFRVKYLNPE